jgi:hypothetical protein
MKRSRQTAVDALPPKLDANHVARQRELLAAANDEFMARAFAPEESQSAGGAETKAPSAAALAAEPATRHPGEQGEGARERKDSHTTKQGVTASESAALTLARPGPTKFVRRPPPPPKPLPSNARPIPGFDGYGITLGGTVYRGDRAISQSTVCGKQRVQLVGPTGYTSRTIERLLREVWP